MTTFKFLGINKKKLPLETVTLTCESPYCTGIKHSDFRPKGNKNLVDNGTQKRTAYKEMFAVPLAKVSTKSPLIAQAMLCVCALLMLCLLAQMGCCIQMYAMEESA